MADTIASATMYRCRPMGEHSTEHLADGVPDEALAADSRRWILPRLCVPRVTLRRLLTAVGTRSSATRQTSPRVTFWVAGSQPAARPRDSLA